jgi:hypothetical protein
MFLIYFILINISAPSQLNIVLSKYLGSLFLNLKLLLSFIMEVVTTKRGGQKLCLDGHMYTKKTSSARQIIWRCVEREPPTRCNATLKTTPDLLDPMIMKQHVHPPSEEKVDVIKCRETMSNQARTTATKPNHIFTFGTSELSDDAKVHLPDAQTCKRLLRKIRSKHRPQDPASLLELVIPDEWSQTTGDNPVQFLLYDNGVDAPERIIMFATDDHLRKLAACDIWCMDGTFSVAPHLFHQLYVIQGKVGAYFVPLVYVLLQRKTQASYEEMLRVLVDRANVDPSTIIIDFERAARQAITSVLGDQVHVQCCFYHLTQSTWRKIQNLGLTNLYQTDDDFRLFCGKLDALALLPVADVPDAMEHLKQIMPDAAQPLVQYFDQTYVNGEYRQVQRGDHIRIRRIAPIFPPECWNVHQATIDNEPRTNNNSEGWNNKFAGLVCQNHPTVWKLIECLRAECSRTTTILVQDARGIQPKKRSKKTYQELQRRLRNLCEDRLADRKTLDEFLVGVSHNLRCGNPDV